MSAVFSYAYQESDLRDICGGSIVLLEVLRKQVFQFVFSLR